MVAAAAMTSCSSFDEPAAMDGEGSPLSRAGERAYEVSSEEDLRDAVDFGMSEINITGDIALTDSLVMNKVITITATKGNKLYLTGKATLVCNANTYLKGVAIEATNDLGTGAITLGSDNIEVILDNVNLTQNAVGTEDARSKAGIAIKYEAYDNSLIIKNNTVITLPSNKYVRGIDMLPAETKNVKAIKISDSRISIGTNPDFPSTYSRGISFSNVECDSLVVDNSTLEGAYYIINVNGTSKVNAKVINGSTLSGRCGFNIWSNYFTAYVESSTIVGKNNWSGPTETFANVVINTTAEHSNMTFKNATFKMDVSNEYQSNRQYAIQYRASNQTLLVEGATTVIDTKDNNVTAYVTANYGVNNISASVKDFTFIDTNANCKNFF